MTPEILETLQQPATEFRFDDWSRLHDHDPDCFEQKRRDVLHSTIAKAPAEHQAGMQAVLDDWEARAAGITDPVERARAALDFAGESFNALMRAVHRMSVYAS